MQYRPRGEARLEALELARLGTRRTAVSSESLGVQLPRPLRLTWGQNVTRRVLIWVRIKGLVRRRLRNFRSGEKSSNDGEWREVKILEAAVTCGYENLPEPEGIS